MHVSVVISMAKQGSTNQHHASTQQFWGKVHWQKQCEIPTSPTKKNSKVTKKLGRNTLCQNLPLMGLH